MSDHIRREQPGDPRQLTTPIVQRLCDAWNRADGAAFGHEFTENAHFIDIRADHHRGAIAIGKGHQAIFDTIYKGSTLAAEVLDAQAIADDVVYAVARSTLDAPSGPLAGKSGATFSLVLKREGNTWKVFSFHNTLAFKK